jgi:FXSXX-COOH protein
MTLAGRRGRLPLDHQEGDRMGDEDHRIESDLIDLRGVDLVQLAASGDSALLRALRRVQDGSENPDEVIAAFQQSI